MGMGAPRCALWNGAGPSARRLTYSPKRNALATSPIGSSVVGAGVTSIPPEPDNPNSWQRNGSPATASVMGRYEIHHHRAAARDADARSARHPVAVLTGAACNGGRLSRRVIDAARTVDRARGRPYRCGHLACRCMRSADAAPPRVAHELRTWMTFLRVMFGRGAAAPTRDGSGIPGRRWSGPLAHAIEPEESS